MQRVRFVGRESELSLVRDWVSGEKGTRRLVFLTGGGGIGKTRFLQEVSHLIETYSPPPAGDLLSSLKVAVVSEISHSEWFLAFMTGVGDVAERLGVRVIPPFRQLSMADQLESLIPEEPDAILVNLGGVEPIAEKLRRAIGRGIKILTVDNFIELDGIVSRITQDDFQGSRESLNALAGDLDFRGRAAALWVEGYVPLERRSRVLEAVKELYPGIEWIDERPLTLRSAAQAEAESYTRVLQLIEEHPDLNAIWATWDELAKGAVRALGDAGRRDISVHGFDLGPTDFKLMTTSDSPWKTTVAANPVEAGRIVAQLGILAALGEKVPRQYGIPMSLFRADQLQDVTGGEFKWELVEQVSPQLFAELRHFEAEPPIADAEATILSIDVIDFDDTYFHVMENLGLHLVRHLSTKATHTYVEKLSQLRHEREQVGPGRIALIRNEAADLLADLFNEVSQRQRIVLFFDTTEKLDEEETLELLARFMSRTRNAVFLVAGRDEGGQAHLIRFVEATSGRPQIDRIELKGLGPKDSMDLLMAHQDARDVSIESSLAERILWLADGRPILIALAADYLSQSYPLPWLAQESLEQLKAQAPEIQKSRKSEFEWNLVRNIGQLRTPLDELCQVMAHVYPVDTELAADLLDELSGDEVSELFDTAQTFTFIKSLAVDDRVALALHDEMRDLVRQFVLEEVDPDQAMRREYSQIAAQYWSRKIRALKTELISLEEGTPEVSLGFIPEVLRRRIEKYSDELISHSLYADVQNAFPAWSGLFEERFSNRDYDGLVRLTRIGHNYSEAVTEEQRFEYDRSRARSALQRGHIDEASELLEEMLARSSGKEEHESAIYDQLAEIEIRRGDLRMARVHKTKCLEIVQRTNPSKAPFVLNRLGYIHRLLHELDEAESCYRRAMDQLLDERLPETRLLLADVLNNLGYVKGLQRNAFLMDQYCRNAIEIWQQLNSRRNIGRAETVMGTVARDNGHFDVALRFLFSAVDRYEMPQDHVYLLQTLLHLGWTQWFMAELQDPTAEDITKLRWDVHLLGKARRSLEQSRQISLEYVVESELPAILHQLASVYWYLGRSTDDPELCQRARMMNADALSRAETLADVRYMADCITGYAEWDYEDGDYTHMAQYADTLQGERYDFSAQALYQGRMRRILGDIAFYQGHYQEAFDHYAEGIPLVNRDGGFAWWTTERELLRIENKMKNHLDDGDRARWTQFLRTSWSNATPSRLLDEWCEQQIVNIRLKAMRS